MADDLYDLLRVDGHLRIARRGQAPAGSHFIVCVQGWFARDMGWVDA